MFIGTVFRTIECSTEACACQQKTRREREITDFGKEVKKKLIDEDKTQKWLASEVSEKTGLKPDQNYLNKILRGEKTSSRVTAAISEILGINV